MELHYQVKPILYTNMKFYNQHFAGKLFHYPLWIARYSNRFPYLEDNRTWQFWQYGDRGRLSGIQGYVDFNVFQGTPEEFSQLGIPLEVSVQVSPSAARQKLVFQ